MERLKLIKIAHCSHSYFLGEGERDLKKLVLNDWYAKTARQIKKYNPEIEIECWAPEKIYKKDEEFIDAEIKYRFFPVTFSPVYALDFSIPMLKELKKEIEKSKKENYKLIIHIHEIHNLHGLLIASFFGKEKLIVQHHGGSWPMKHLMQTKRYKLFFPLFILGQIWENIVLKNIKCFFVLSKDEMNYLNKVAPKSKVIFQTMGIEDEYFKTIDKKTARKKLHLKQDKKILLFLGRINQVKGVGTLLEAMLKLKDKKDIELKIAGFGPEEEKFKNYVKENELKNVEFLGGVFGDKKLLYLSAADALVLPSSKEGAPVSVMEAMAKNLPSIATNVGGVSLMIENGQNGLVINPRKPDEIVNAVNEILAWKGKNIRKYAEKYKWKEIIKNTVENYKII
ncbi:MAG: glycosyltransferase family 4 protein [Nanoarchaeota archaeon]|nr:glycosyltransferase family 4 protein [Nanoarchaeota archaeon]